ncbi:hypothetical protein PHM1_023 [Eurybiavirus PHM1]|uniref:Uncharacterized protein n=1 Tax=Prochlorococcus phage P-HM1 TaxID=445700 RepID=E3SMK4_9CAUD|nr:hypothetical protein PHM1_023 [Prochlorococcus phage P-HM1]ADO98647.1 hypothetical protein PHM1_023 [Prochlorococcus phage P-HM1]
MVLVIRNHASQKWYGIIYSQQVQSRHCRIIDDIGQILGVFMQKKGSGVGLEAQVKAQFTCNEPEGSGAKFKPNIVNGKVESVDVINPGIGYGFDPADTFCPKEQYAVLVPKEGLQQHVNDGEYLEQMVTGNPDVLQVVDTEYSDDDMLIATIDPSFNPNFVAGLQLKTKSGHEFTLNFNSKFPTLVIPPNAKALYAGCGDIIPKLDEVKITNVGSNYVDPKICIGVGDKEQCIGTATTDKDGKLISISLDTPVLGFVKPEIVDSQGTGGRLSTNYIYTSPREIRETNVLPLTQYIDCVGHPMIKSKKEDEDTSLQDTAFNLVDGQDTTTTTDGDTTTTVSTPTVADPVSTPVNQDTTQPTQQTQQQTQQIQQTQQTDNNQQQNQQNQGGYGGY